LSVDAFAGIKSTGLVRMRSIALLKEVVAITDSWTAESFFTSCSIRRWRLSNFAASDTNENCWAPQREHEGSVAVVLAPQLAQ
jgi:hypothetical protein